jgi:hypothetical protein
MAGHTTRYSIEPAYNLVFPYGVVGKFNYLNMNKFFNLILKNVPKNFGYPTP